WDWSWPAALVFGLSLSVASTVVLLRALTERGRLGSPEGRIAVGWLVVEDIVVVIALVLLPAAAGFLGGTPGGLAAAKTEDLAWALGLTVGKFALFAALMIPFGRRAVPWLLVMVAHLKSRELFTLAVLSMAIGIAFLSAKVFGVSFALGAFFAGMVMHGSGMATRAAEQSLPFRDAFAVLFFVAVGMMFDPAILIEDPLAVAATVAIVVLGKSAAAILLMVIFRQSRAVVWTVAAALAQVGELTLVMADQALKLGLLPPQGRDLALSAVLISIALNPLAFLLASRLARHGAEASKKTKEPAALAAGSVTSSD
ncbi:MAG: cation:proton antiporter, partial [Elioraea sp.]|nr:cation:proton antiporter [Elioraea sp.]